jgi:hypothetical protein
MYQITSKKKRPTFSGGKDHWRGAIRKFDKY